MNEYPENWDEIALEIKEAAGWRCEHCGHPHDPPAGYTLTTHHLDSNKSNCDRINLVAFCQRCHLHFENKDLSKQGWFFGTPEWLARRLLPGNGNGEDP